MSFLPAELLPYVKYATPPLVGAFIGYLTNKVAIKMLFRPLKPWYLLGKRIPMTPGVIPSRREHLAENMGEVVGDHLLTSTEIGSALQEEKFQQHLLNVIAERVGDILHRDLPPVPDLIPTKFTFYRDIGIRAFKYQLLDNVQKFISTDDFARVVDHAVDDKLEQFLELEVKDVLNDKQREAIYSFVEDSISRMFAGQEMAQWLDTFIRQQVYGALKEDKSLKDILPQSLLEFIEISISEQTPNLLRKLAVIIKDPEVRDGIVRGTCSGVENFIVSLGPMAPMVQNFITMETVDVKIREYLDEKEEDIAQWLSSEDFQEKVSTILSERFSLFSTTPLVQIVKIEDSETVEEFCSTVSRQLLQILQGREVAAALSSMVRSNIEAHLEEGGVQIHTMLDSFVGGESVRSGREWVKSEVVSLIRSAETMSTVGSMIDGMVDSLLKKRVGKLSRILPADVRKEIYVSIQKITSAMLAKEVPGLVASLDIKTIVADKINSLDLLRLERLLLSIMEEQFKYINLFGALLGFILGCANLVFIYLT